MLTVTVSQSMLGLGVGITVILSCRDFLLKMMAKGAVSVDFVTNDASKVDDRGSFPECDVEDAARRNNINAQFEVTGCTGWSGRRIWKLCKANKWRVMIGLIIIIIILSLIIFFAVRDRGDIGNQESQPPHTPEIEPTPKRHPENQR